VTPLLSCIDVTEKSWEAKFCRVGLYHEQEQMDVLRLQVFSGLLWPTALRPQRICLLFQQQGLSQLKGSEGLSVSYNVGSRTFRFGSTALSEMLFFL
jgi:hypothetical protein